MIGSRAWIERAERKWNGRLPFDRVRAFRSACLREASSQRPRSWNGVPWVLHCWGQRSELHPKFVAYLDRHIEIKEWRDMYRELQHQDLQFWADRLKELTT